MRKNEIITLLLVAGILTMAVLISSLLFYRFDLTENKIYTVSPVSRSVARDIPERLTISYYLSDELRDRFVETQQIADLIYQYAAYSRGRISVEVVDPNVAGVTTDIEILGITPRQIQVIEENQQSVAVVYSGVVISYLDRTEIIPFVLTPSAIEYEVTTAIRNVVSQRETNIGIVIGNSQRTIERDYQQITRSLRQSYSVEVIGIGDNIPSNIATLVVLGADSLDEYSLFPIDQHIMRGGGALFAVDGTTVSLEAGLDVQPIDEDAPIIPLLENYGARLRRALALDSNHLRIPVQQQSGGGFIIQQFYPYPFWVQVFEDSVNSTHPVTARFAGADFYWASPLEILDEERVETLISTSPNGFIQMPPFNVDPTVASTLPITDTSERGAYPLVISINPPFESFYDEIPTRPGEEPIWTELVESGDSGRVVVVGDSDIVSSFVQFSNSVQNFTFAENLISWLANDEDLIDIRTRSTRNQRLSAIEDEDRRSFIAGFAAFINIYFIPLLVIGYGIFRMARKRRLNKLTLGSNAK